ncbi:MAG: hypothetical protein M3Q14_01805 [bacterium]|nr:hypothetical protein [bacterium]
MVNAFLAAVCIAGILTLSELAWRRMKIKGEWARKAVHIIAGTFIAFLPFWVDYQWIKVLATGFVLVNLINRYTNFFHAIHAVKRKSWGEVLFGVGVFMVALFEPSPWLFAASIMQVSIADGLAALAGVTYGHKHGEYYLFGQPKTYVGSGVFILSSILILLSLFLFNNYYAEPLSLWPVLVMLPIVLVSFENIAVYGLDNIVLPLVALGVLNMF